MEIWFTFPLLAENIFRPLLASFELEKQLAIYTILLQNFFKAIQSYSFLPLFQHR